jgi:hypothetical protein
MIEPQSDADERLAKIATLVFDNRNRGRNGALRASILLKLQRLVEPYRTDEDKAGMVEISLS